MRKIVVKLCEQARMLQLNEPIRSMKACFQFLKNSCGIKLFLALFLLFILLLRENSYSLELSDLVEKAKQHPEILKIEEKIKSVEARVKKVQTLPDPMIELGFYKNEMGMMENSLMFQQVLPYQGKLRLMGEVEKQEIKMLEEELEATTLKKIAETKKDYYDLFLINKEIEITERTKEYLKLIEEIANTMFSTGMLPQTDVLRIQTEISMQTEKLIMFRAKKETTIYRIMWKDLGVAELAVSSEEERETGLATPTELPQTELKNYEEYQNIVLEKSPMLRMIGYEIEMKKKEIELARKEFRPDFVSSMELMNMDKGKKIFDAWNIKFGVMYPLYKNKKQKNAKIEAEQNLLSVEKKYEQEKLELIYMLKESYLMAQSASENMRLYKTGIIPQANLTWTSALANYKTGKIDFLMLFDNLMKLQESELNYYELFVEHEKAVAEVERLAVGQ